MLKKIFIGLGILFFVFVGVIGYFVYVDFQQEAILEKEVLNWSNKDLLKDNFSISIKTKGEYAYVENAIKKFYKELSDNVKIINQYMDDERFTHILSVQNIQDDKPDFISSNKMLLSTKNEVTKALESIVSLCDEENIKNLLDKEKVSDYTIDYYKKLMYTEQDLKYFKEVKEEMQQMSSDLNLFLDKVKEILDMLVRSNGSWFIEGEQLYFDNASLVEEYNGLYNDLKRIAIEKFHHTDSDSNVSQNDSSIQVIIF